MAAVQPLQLAIATAKDALLARLETDGMDADNNLKTVYSMVQVNNSTKRGAVRHDGVLVRKTLPGEQTIRRD